MISALPGIAAAPSTCCIGISLISVMLLSFFAAPSPMQLFVHTSRHPEIVPNPVHVHYVPFPGGLKLLCSANQVL